MTDNKQVSTPELVQTAAADVRKSLLALKAITKDQTTFLNTFKAACSDLLEEKRVLEILDDNHVPYLFQDTIRDIKQSLAPPGWTISSTQPTKRILLYVPSHNCRDMSINHIIDQVDELVSSLKVGNGIPRLVVAVVTKGEYESFVRLFGFIMWPISKILIVRNSDPIDMICQQITDALNE